ncbi:MAG TPA: T9SS type A sorting domain-containing protein, partial [Ignavibacteria bacterium]|nr:T9SS type A sorting domain-containing protein [Ignavibacteria bacterium]
QSGMIVYGYAVSSTGNVIKITDTLDILTGTNPINNLPNGYSLSQNYPNPFNPQTMITYSVPQSSFVNITVFDILGREIYSPVNEIKKAGSYELNINAGQIGSGIYYYRMSAGDFSDTKKMIVIK